ncbi:MAG TPA: O-antigen ligase family protein [Myxococcota bacterium]|nr:O-antigen ligase family protein [Myxococcota bacterium]
MQGELRIGFTRAPLAERGAGLAQAADRFGQLAFAAALAFVANLYASPAFYWPVFEKARLGVVTSGLCAFAVLMRRITSGERLKLGGAPAAVLLAYAAVFPLSFAWTISPSRTGDAVVDVAKLLVLYVALVNALDTPSRLRAFLLVGALATLAPSLGGIDRWVRGEDLVEGYRTAWRGNYADPNRLAMGLVLMIPAALALAGEARRRLTRALLLFAAVAGVAAVVLTHSRSGAVALAAALALMLLRSRRRGRALLLALVGAVTLVALAPRSFWARSESIAAYEDDPSFSGRERAWRMLMVIFEERPFTGVGAGGFIDAWDRFAPLSAQGRRLIAHNIFMETLGELGVIALLLFAAYCAWLLARLWKAGRDPVAGVDARALFAGLTGYIVCELVNGYARAFNLYAAFAAAAAAAAMASLRRRLAEDAGDGPREGA